MLCPARAVTPALSSLSAIAATGTGFRHVWERAGCLPPASCPLPSLKVVNTGDLGQLPALPLTSSVTEVTPGPAAWPNSNNAPARVQGA